MAGHGDESSLVSYCMLADLNQETIDWPQAARAVRLEVSLRFGDLS